MVCSPRHPHPHRLASPPLFLCIPDRKGKNIIDRRNMTSPCAEGWTQTLKNTHEEKKKTLKCIKNDQNLRCVFFFTESWGKGVLGTDFFPKKQIRDSDSTRRSCNLLSSFTMQLRLLVHCVANEGLSMAFIWNGVLNADHHDNH